MYLRRITLERPGEEEVSLLTNLLDAEAVPAQDLLATYLDRWSIERAFQQVTEVFHLQRFISSTPNGASFQFALCSLLYNVLQVVRAYIAAQESRASALAINGGIRGGVLRHGDSGGPLYCRPARGAWRVLGVVSGGDVTSSGKSTGMEYYASTVSYSFRTFLEQVLAEWGD